MKRIYSSLLIISLLSFVLFSCKDTPSGEDHKKVISVSVLPQKYFVEKIAGDQMEVNVMIPPGASPVTYEPTPEQMKDISRSVAYFRIGPLVFEKSWMDKFKSVNPELKVYDQSSQVSLIRKVSHSHSGNHKRDVNNDPHIWTSPARVDLQLQVIRDALLQLDSLNAKRYRTNYQSFKKEINELDQFIRNELSGLENRKFMIFHPALTYYARDYNLTQVSIEFEGKEPSPGHLKELVDLAKDENIQVIFIQKQFNKETAQAIADEIDGKVIEINPLAYDWVQQMKSITQKLADALKAEKN